MYKLIDKHMNSIVLIISYPAMVQTSVNSKGNSLIVLSGKIEAMELAIYHYKRTYFHKGNMCYHKTYFIIIMSFHHYKYGLT